jgi:hypothetical protein
VNISDGDAEGSEGNWRLILWSDARQGQREEKRGARGKKTDGSRLRVEVVGTNDGDEEGSVDGRWREGGRDKECRSDGEVNKGVGGAAARDRAGQLANGATKRLRQRRVKISSTPRPGRNTPGERIFPVEGRYEPFANRVDPRITQRNSGENAKAPHNHPATSSMELSQAQEGITQLPYTRRGQHSEKVSAAQGPSDEPGAPRSRQLLQRESRFRASRATLLSSSKCMKSSCGNELTNGACSFDRKERASGPHESRCQAGLALVSPLSSFASKLP